MSILFVASRREKKGGCFFFVFLPKVFKAKCVFFGKKQRKPIFETLVCGVNGGKYAILASVSGIGVEAPWVCYTLLLASRKMG